MSRGGKRVGAGRPAGTENRDTSAARAALSSLMEGHVQTAIEALSDIAQNGQSEAARVSAACAILDRTHGRPRSAPNSAPLHGIPDDPFDCLRIGSWP